MSPEPCQSPASPRSARGYLSNIHHHEPTGRPSAVGSQGVHRPTRASRDLRCCMAAAPALISEGPPTAPAIALCCSVAGLPHRLDGLPRLGGRCRFGTPSPSACRDAWGRLHHAQIGRSQLFAIALPYGLRSVVWTADLDRERGR